MVGTVIISISFITGPLSQTTQRFLSYEIGLGNKENVKIIFSQSVILYIILCGILLVILETLGLWFLRHKLMIPPDKLNVTLIVYQCVIISFIGVIARMPYDALIIAKEQMQFYAYISIIDVIMRLAIVYVLLLFNNTSYLVLYGILTAIVSIIITIIYKVYCNKKYIESHIIFQINKSFLKEMGSLYGWNIFGALAVVSTTQGISIVLNIFFGVIINAAMGITNQVGNAVNQFVSNFQVAFNPQIVKTYAKNEIAKLHLLIFRTCKLSFILLLMIGYPLIKHMDYILTLWLGDKVPPYTPILCSLLIISLLIDSFSAPLWMVIQATGKVRSYQLTISCVILCNILFSYIFLHYGFSPYITMIIRCFICLLCFGIRIFFLKHKIKFPLSQYIKHVILPVAIVTILSIILSINIDNFITLSNKLLDILSSTILFWIIITISSYYIIFSFNERNSIKSILLNFIKKR